MEKTDRPGAKLAPILLALALMIALFFLLYPFYVIRPFRHQGARELQAALAVLGMRPWVEIACLGSAVLGAIFSWRLSVSRWPRIVAVSALTVVIASAVLSRINIYERMFHPIGTPRFEPLAESKLDNGEMVLAIRRGAETRAYPIRVISYHHIVNDTLGGVPIAATY